MGAGLPNITGQWFAQGLDNGILRDAWGCTKLGWVAGNGYLGHARKDGAVPFLDFTASGSSYIYGSSSTVTPLSLRTLCILKY